MKPLKNVFFCPIVIHILLIFLWSSTGFSAEGVEWGSVRFVPKLSVAEKYSDNIFLNGKDVQDGYVTAISPELLVDFALATRNILSLSYEGNFRFYSELDNFRKDHHRCGLFWRWIWPRESEFAAGAKVQDSTIQPYSEEDRHKDFVKPEAFADILLKLGAFTDLGVRYNRISRRFDNPLDEIDEFDRDTITLNILYKAFPLLPLLFEYSYYHQDNNDLGGFSTDMDTNTVFIGARWDPASRLSGALKIGYTQTDFEEVSDFSGFATDTNLLYRFSTITTFKLSAYRRVVKSTRAGRDTGDYLISSGGSLSATYRTEPITIVLDLSYTNNDFQQEASWNEDREDNYFRAGMQGKYLMREWLLFSLGYQYSRNDSNYATVDYIENRVEAEFFLVPLW